MLCSFYQISDLSQFGVIAIITLIIFLSVKEIMSASNMWNRAIGASLDAVIVPLLISFTAIVVWEVAKVL
ncbi:MAG: hypothetical protein P1P80_07100 [ANME-2 cluster archaeon]|nr:hypothetical protein [ANME-2 cluster archaeon]